MLDQRRRRWAAIVQMLYKCFVFTGKLYAEMACLVKWQIKQLDKHNK